MWEPRSPPPQSFQVAEESQKTAQNIVEGTYAGPGVLDDGMPATVPAAVPSSCIQALQDANWERGHRIEAIMH